MNEESERHVGRAVARAMICLALLLGTRVDAAEQKERVVPAKPGGGFDLTCRLVVSLLDAGKPGPTPAMCISYLPGGIGAVAFTSFTSQRASDSSAVLAFSAGSLLNLVQGKFGPHTARDVGWLAAIGTDYGVTAVEKLAVSNLG